MKNLWMYLPPLLADNFGMIEVLRHTDGCGVIDDSGEFRLTADRHSGPDPRVAVSGVENTDVIAGTKAKVLAQAERIAADYRPAFLMFSAGPCGAMIGTDLSEIAEEFARTSGIPCGTAELTGQKTYDVGISKTLAGMAKLLTAEGQAVKGRVNLIGATELDWSAEDISGVRRWMESKGFQVIAQPGARVTAAELRDMATAECNVVLSVAGLEMARYLEKQFGTPWLPLAPFGAVNRDALLERKLPEDAENAEVTTLIVAEQLTGNAIRRVLEGLLPGETARVCTFYQLDKRCARPGDRKLKGEAEAKELLASGAFRRVIADPLLRRFSSPGVQWIDLPHRAMHTYGSCEMLSLLGERCDKWLKKNL